MWCCNSFPQVLTEALGQLRDISRHLPPATLQRRLKLLEEGVEEVTSRARVGHWTEFSL